MAISVNVASTNRASLIDWTSFSIRRGLMSTPDECQFSYTKYGSLTFVPARGDAITVLDGATNIFGGEIADVQVVLQDEVEIYKVKALGYQHILDKRIVDAEYRDDTVNEIITDMFGDYTTGYNIDNVSCTVTLASLSLNEKKFSKCLDQIAERVNYLWYVDGAKNVHFFDYGTKTNATEVTDDSSIVIKNSLNLTTDNSEYANYITLIGSYFTTVTVDRSSGLTRVDYTEKTDEIKSQSEANDYATELANYREIPQQVIQWSSYDNTYSLGEAFTVDSTRLDIDSTFYIQSIEVSMHTSSAFVYTYTAVKKMPLNIRDFFQKQDDEIGNNTTSVVGDGQFLCTVKFGVTDYNTISWGSGKIRYPDGTEYSISSGTSDVTGIDVVYFDPNVSTTVLQVSGTLSNAFGLGKATLMYAEENANTSKGASIYPVSFGYGVKIDGASIVASTVLAEQIAASTITADKMNVSTLSSISANIGTITAGTVTGATLQTASSGARVLMNSSDFRGYNSSNANTVKIGGSAGEVATTLLYIGIPDDSGEYGLWQHSDAENYAWLNVASDGTSANFYFYNNGNFTLSGTVTGGAWSSSGNVNAGSFSIGSNNVLTATGTNTTINSSLGSTNVGADIAGGGKFYIYRTSEVWYCDDAGNTVQSGNINAGQIVPRSDNAYTCGANGARWSAVWSANGTIQTSDERLKKNITELSESKLEDLHPIEYEWKDKPDHRRKTGFSAQEVLAVYPDAVWGNEQNGYGINYSFFIPILVKEIQDLKKQVYGKK